MEESRMRGERFDSIDIGDVNNTDGLVGRLSFITGL